MQTLEKDDFRTIIEDARARHAAVAALIYFTDTQAMGVLRLYLTIGVAAASGAAAGFSQPYFIPFAAACALMSATVMLVIGSFLCLLAMTSGEINLPGRNPDFWLWAINPRVERSEVLRSYLEQLVKRAKINSDFNEKTARALKYAKYCAVFALATAVFVGAIALRFQP